MKKLILSCLFNAVLLVVLCLPAEARVVIGLTPAAPLTGVDQITLAQLGNGLEKVAGTTIKVRLFDNDAAITNWLLRFQEIDAAIVARGFIKQQPAGTLKHLADLHAKSPAAPPLALVTRSNISNDQATQAKEAFLKLGESATGRKILQKIGLVGATVPGEAFKRKVAKPAPPTVQPTKKTSTPPVKAEQPLAPPPRKAPAAERKLAETQLPPKAKEQPSTGKAVTAAEPAKEPVKTIEKTVAVEESTKVPEEQKPATVAPEPEKPAKQTQAEKQPEDKPKPSKREAPAKTPQTKSEPNKRLILFVTLIILIAILIKISLLVLRWQNKKSSVFRPVEAPTIETAPERVTSTMPTVTPLDEPDEEELVVEVGQLGPGKLPALLKRCADLPEPVVMQVTKGSCEKLVYFAGGQVSGALTQNASASDTGVRWNKLGNLLVREELITREERDQGMALLTKQPELRFGEALLKLGLIDLAGLRHALTRQAKVTIYSLILFPEGRYQVFAGDGSLPPEESVALEVTSLIREASHHQSEWTAIRQALPNLNTALDYCPDGRDKLANVGLSSQQQATLALIDGKQSINDICIESNMMDYEVYRFLYLMVKAGVLE